MRVIFLLAFVVPQILFAQDTIRIKHLNYETVFSQKQKYPVIVQWWLTKDKLNCKNPVKRQNNFAPDPMLTKESNLAESYIGSGYDRGHMSPAADAQCDVKQMDESFYFTNMAPQTPQLNRGEWKYLEEWTRQQSLLLDSIKISAGCVGKKQVIKQLTIPTYCWKVLQIKKSKQTLAYVFENGLEKNVSFEGHKVSIDSIKKLTGFTFK